MVVWVQTILDLVPLLGGSKIAVEAPEGSTVRDVLAALVERGGEPLEKKLINPADGAPYPYLRLVLNGRDIAFLEGLETAVRDGDTLLIFPPATGG